MAVAGVDERRHHVRRRDGLLVANRETRPALLVMAAGMLLSPLLMALSPIRSYAAD